MTKEEKINLLKYCRDINADYPITDEDIDTLIKALEQESVLDKIRAEIEEERDSWDKWDGDEADYYYSYNKCLEIIDKYKAESEGEG